MRPPEMPGLLWTKTDKFSSAGRGRDERRRICRRPKREAIYEDFFDAGGKFKGFWNVERSMTVAGLKRTEIGEGAFAKDAAIFPAESLREQVSHLTDCFWQREAIFSRT